MEEKVDLLSKSRQRHKSAGTRRSGSNKSKEKEDQKDNGLMNNRHDWLRIAERDKNVLKQWADWRKMSIRGGCTRLDRLSARLKTANLTN